jgi:hypothetical protein
MFKVESAHPADIAGHNVEFAFGRVHYSQDPTGMSLAQSTAHETDDFCALFLMSYVLC